jgi:hypothetical protein
MLVELLLFIFMINTYCPVRECEVDPQKVCGINNPLKRSSRGDGAIQGTTTTLTFKGL